MNPGEPSADTAERVLGGRYRLLTHIADGGMASVWLAVDDRLGRRVAVKILRPDLARDSAFVDRFRREARLSSSLSHPNIVAVHDFEDAGDELYLVQEYVEGQTLRTRLAESGAMPVRAAVRTFSAILGALAAAHRAGLVHRDVKPENVLVRPDGTLKVTDFGLARAVTSATRTSSTGVVLGTVSYLAPEQLDSDRADARSDVYAAGLILYELLTGAKAFSGENPMHVAYQHVHGAVPRASDRIATVPLELDHLIAQAAAKNPADRPADAGQLQSQLRDAVRQLSDEELDAAPVYLGGAVQAAAAAPAAPPPPAATSLDPGRAPDTTPNPAVDPSAQTQPDVGAESMAGSRAEATERIGVATQRLVLTQPAGPTNAEQPPQPSESIPATAATAAAAAPLAESPDRGPRRRATRWLAWLLPVLLLGGGGGGWWWYDSFGPGALRTVPTLQQRTRAEAVAALAAVDLQGMVLEEFSETVPKDEVIQAGAAPGSELPKRSSVQLLVSKGPERYVVPDLVKQPAAAVESALTERHLRLGTVTQEYSETVPVGVVLRQDPPAETSVKPDTPVSVVLSKGREPIPVTDFTGKPAIEAEQGLTSAGLKVGRGEPVFSDTVPEGAVVSQTPNQGALFKGDQVTIVVSKGPELFPVPNVVGMNRNKATTVLQAAGFKVAYNNVLGGFFGTVRMSDPAPGSKVRKGSTITLTIV